MTPADLLLVGSMAGLAVAITIADLIICLRKRHAAVSQPSSSEKASGSPISDPSGRGKAAVR